MIVTCERCSARYKLDDNKIKGRGARITCPKCQHVFVVYRRGAEAEATSGAPAASSNPLAQDQESDSGGDFIPLFPDHKGKVITKRGVVSSLEDVLGRLGVDVVNSGGRRRFGGHSLRVTGSRYWTGRGLEVFKVQIFARWGSNVILRYVSDVPIANLSADLALGPSSSGGPSNGSVAQLLESFIEHAKQQFETLKAEIERLDQSVNPSYFQNTDTKTWHKVLISGPSIPPTKWKAQCGWKFGLSSFRLCPAGPPTGARLCDRCFPPVVPSPPSGSDVSSDADESHGGEWGVTHS